MKKSLIKATIYTGVYGAILIVVRLISKQPLETLLFVSLFYFAIGFFYGNIFRDRKEYQRGFHNGMNQAMKSFIMPMAFSDIFSSVVQHADCDCENCDQKTAQRIQITSSTPTLLTLTQVPRITMVISKMTTTPSNISLNKRPRYAAFWHFKRTHKHYCK